MTFKLQKPRTPFLVAIFAALFAFGALAVTSGPINSLPKADIVQDNGTVNAKGFSFDTTFTALRGALVGDTTNGYFVLNRSGLYRLTAQCNGAAANGETSTIEIASTVDDSNYTTCDGGTASFVALTGALTQGMTAQCYLALSSGAAALGTTHVVVRGKNSAGTLTCKSMSLLNVERVDQLQPAAYP